MLSKLSDSPHPQCGTIRNWSLIKSGGGGGEGAVQSKTMASEPNKLLLFIYLFIYSFIHSFYYGFFFLLFLNLQ